MNVVSGFIVPSGLMELYLVARFQILLLSSLKAGIEILVIGLKRIKKANPNPSIIKNKTTKNGKTSSATPIIMEKYFPYDRNTLKNNTNLKVNNKIEIAVICPTI